jgi:hypothetical protein
MHLRVVRRGRGAVSPASAVPDASFGCRISHKQDRNARLCRCDACLCVRGPLRTRERVGTQGRQRPAKAPRRDRRRLPRRRKPCAGASQEKPGLSAPLGGKAPAAGLRSETPRIVRAGQRPKQHPRRYGGGHRSGATSRVDTCHGFAQPARKWSQSAGLPRSSLDVSGAIRHISDIRAKGDDPWASSRPSCAP